MFKILFLSVVVNTIITIAGLSALSVENSIVLGIVCGLLDIIPYVGIFIIFLPLFVYYMRMKQYIIAFGIILLYILLMVNTQMIQTKFMSNKLQIHPSSYGFSSLYRNEKFWSSRDDYGTIVCYNSK